MLPEKVQKEIEMKTLLQIPFDSKEIIDEFSNNELFFRYLGNLVMTTHRDGLAYKGKYWVDHMEIVESNYSRFSEILKKKDDMFCIGHYSQKEKFKLNVTVNDKPFEKVISGMDLGNYTTTSLLHIMGYFDSVESLPTTIKIEGTVMREKDLEDRKTYFKSLRNGSCEQYLNEIFGTKIDDSRLAESSHAQRTNWRNPFDRKSLKGIIYRMDKERATFLIEYFWGKKLPMSCSNKRLCNFLASAQNKRFGINDVQVAKKLTESLWSSDYNVLKTELKAIGIEPATDMNRWIKLRNLTK